MINSHYIRYIGRHASSYLCFWAVVSLIYSLTVITAELSSLPMNGLRSCVMAVGQWVMIAGFSWGLIGLMSLSKWVFALLFTPFLILSAVIAFFSVTIGTGLTATTIEIALVNDAAMWTTMLSPGLVITVIIALLAGVAAAVVRWKRVESPTGRIGLWLFLIFAIVSTLPLLAPSRLANAIGARMPYSIYFGLRDYLANRHEILTERHAFDGISAVAPADAPDVIVVLGESLRADHLPMNGYERNTMPNISNDTSVISFPNVKGHAFYTHTAVPLILTRARGRDFECAYEEPSFITLFNKAGFNTAWFANQDLGSSYTYFAHEADTLAYTNASRSLYVYSDWLDTDLLQPVGEWLSGSPRKGRASMAVIHTIGSHWWYKSHYTDDDARFLPDTHSKDIGSLTNEQIINAYDNTIVATDRFLASLFSMLRSRNAVVVFISDHGEALGEDGLYLHGVDHESIHRPACLVWVSPEFGRRYPHKVEAMKASRLKDVTTDVIFHTVLDAGEISTPIFDSSLSLMYNEADSMD